MKNKVKSIVTLALCLCLAGCNGNSGSTSDDPDTQTSASVETYSLESVPIKSFIESYNRYSDVKFKINDAKLYSPYEVAYISDAFTLGLTDNNNNMVLTFVTSDQSQLSGNFNYCLKALGTKMTDEEITAAWENTLKNGQNGHATDVCGAYYREEETEKGTAYFFNLTYAINPGQTDSEPLLTFELVAGEKGKYGKSLIYNADTDMPEKIIAYYVPYGKYKVVNIGKYPTQINVCSDQAQITDGWEGPVNYLYSDFVDVKANIIINVPEKYHIEIAEPTHIKLELITE